MQPGSDRYPVRGVRAQVHVQQSHQRLRRLHELQALRYLHRGGPARVIACLHQLGRTIFDIAVVQEMRWLVHNRHRIQRGRNVGLLVAAGVPEHERRRLEKERSQTKQASSQRKSRKGKR